MSKAQEIIKKLLEEDNIEAFSSKESLKKVLKENELTDEDIDSALEGIKDFPIDDEDLDMITGGLTSGRRFMSDISKGSIDFSREEE